MTYLCLVCGNTPCTCGTSKPTIVVSRVGDPEVDRLRAQLEAEKAARMKAEAEASVSKLIHSPECWDTTAYPSLEIADECDFMLIRGDDGIDGNNIVKSIVCTPEKLESFRAEIERRAVPECTWTETDEYWETSCGNAFVLEADTPEENDMRFCPYCGGKLVTAQSPKEES